MQYSNFVENQPVYKRDEDGNIIYIEVDGEQVPVTTGTTESRYAEPTEFKAVITNKLNEAIIQSYGIDVSTNYAQITARKDYLPLKVGSLVWKRTQPTYKEDGTVDETSADYTVKGVADEGLDFDLFLLQRNVQGA